VGKQARRENRERARVAPLFRAVEAAGRAAELVEQRIVAQAAELMGMTERRAAGLQPAGHWEKVRAGVRRNGLRWPSWCWLPESVIGSVVMRDLREIVGSEAAEAEGDVISGAVLPILAPVVNWQPGRVVVRFHPELLAVLVATPLDRLPTEVIYRFPYWAAFFETPHLGEGTGVFVALDPNMDPSAAAAGQDPCEVHSDELTLTFVAPDRAPPIIYTPIQLAEPTLQAALFDYLGHGRRERVRPADAAHATEAEMDEWFGQPVRGVISGVMSMVLYLCAGDVDVTERPLPLAPPGRSRPARADDPPARRSARGRRRRRLADRRLAGRGPHPHRQPRRRGRTDRRSPCTTLPLAQLLDRPPGPARRPPPPAAFHRPHPRRRRRRRPGGHHPAPRATPAVVLTRRPPRICGVRSLLGEPPLRSPLGHAGVTGCVRQSDAVLDVGTKHRPPLHHLGLLCLAQSGQLDRLVLIVGHGVVLARCR
jgi:hypothetical protein